MDRKAAEQPIHGHIYFQQPQPQHPPPQAPRAAQPVVDGPDPAYQQTPTAAAVMAADKGAPEWTGLPGGQRHAPDAASRIAVAQPKPPAPGAVQVLPMGPATNAS